MISRYTVLSIWEKRWGTLSYPHMRQFLRRSELEVLEQCRPDVLVEAITEHQRLIDIVPVAKELMPATYDWSQYPAAPNDFDDSGEEITASWDGQTAPLPAFSEVLVVPLIPEMAVGDRCSACDAWVPSGSVHDCT